MSIKWAISRIIANSVEQKKMDNVHMKKIAKTKKIHEKGRELRGRFLNSVAVIERDIAVILTKYFCTTDKSKQELFFLKVAEKMTLDRKKQVLTEIVKNDYPSYWEELKPFLIDLKKIQEFRNKLAHSVLDVSDEALARPIEDGVGLVQWEKGKPITDKEFEEWEVRANMVISTLINIKRLLPFKENLPSEQS